MLDAWRRRLSELPNQFLLNEDEQPPFPDWTTTPVGKFRLHTHPATQIRTFDDQGSKTFVVGTIVAADGDPVRPESCPPGQFVAITPSAVFSDAGSLMQAFFDRSSRSAASSPRLLGRPDTKAVSPELLHGSRPDWYWGPRTSFAEFDFLLPTQQLDLTSFSPVWRVLPEATNAADGELGGLLERELCTSFQRLAEMGSPIRLAMTGGLDSRTLFAAAIRTGIEFETYTMVSRHVHPLDVRIAKEISDRHHIRHTVLPVVRIDRGELDWYLWFSAGQTMTLDSDFHAAGLWNRFGRDAIHVRGLGFELGRHKYRDFLDPADEALFRTDAKEIWKKFTRPWVRPLHKYNLQAFQTYARWFSETTERSAIDFRDRLYLEQGIGTWCASAEYGLAATGIRRVSIGNSTSVYNLMLKEGSGSKKSGPVQRELMRAIDPGLLDYPFAKPSPSERLRFRAIDTLRALRTWERLRRLR